MKNWSHFQLKPENPLMFICTKEIQNMSRNGWVMAIFSLRGCMILLTTLRTKGNHLGFIGTKKIQNRPRKGWIMAIFSLRGWVIPLRSTWDRMGSFGVDLYQKDLKSVKNLVSYGHFLIERLRDSIEKHMGQRGFLWFSFVPKRSKIGQEMAELWSRGCVIPLRTTWDKMGSFGVY